jgi:hypothetical protein
MNGTITLGGAANTARSLIWMSGPIGPSPRATRWQVSLNGTEVGDGTNVGADWNLFRYADNGAFLGTPFSVRRSDGFVQMTGGGGTIPSVPAGSAVTIRGGAGTTTTGALNLLGAGAGGTATGGAIFITSGTGVTDVSPSGAITINTPNSGATAGGNLTLQAGNVTGSVAAPFVRLTGGSNTGSGNAGGVQMFAGSATGTSGTGGAAQVNSGNSTSGAGGNMTLQTGTGGGGQGGDILAALGTGTTRNGLFQVRISATSNNLNVTPGNTTTDPIVVTPTAAGGLQLVGATNALGFYGAAPAAKPTVSGSQGGNAALASLVAALATLGLITNSTTA